MENAEITKDFLEKALNICVDNFEVARGSAAGDGYTCVLHSVKVYPIPQDGATGSSDPLNIVVKCYPNSAQRQDFLEAGNFFVTELGMYEEVIPELRRFQESIPEEKRIEPPFSKFYGGQSLTSEAKTNLGRPVSTLDNYIVMPDLRTPENGAFRLRDRFLQFDLAHYQLVIEGQARLHALSWAYKKLTGTSDLIKRFSCLDVQKRIDLFSAMETNILESFNESTKGMFPDRTDFHEALDFLLARSETIDNFYYFNKIDGQEFTKDSLLKVPVEPNPEEEPWQVLLHGDAWSNNMMFRYDPASGRPVEVLFVDLQGSSEGDPMSDIMYTLYPCTSGDFRKKHFDSMLHLYFDTFIEVCKNFSVPPLPGFTFPEFKRRFHRAKIFGASQGQIMTRAVFKDSENVADMDAIAAETGEDLLTVMKRLFAKDEGSEILKTRLGEILTEMIESGVI